MGTLLLVDRWALSQAQSDERAVLLETPKQRLNCDEQIGVRIWSEAVLMRLADFV
jgi:hypothetical protein